MPKINWRRGETRQKPRCTHHEHWGKPGYREWKERKNRRLRQRMNQRIRERQNNEDYIEFILEREADDLWYYD